MKMWTSEGFFSLLVSSLTGSEGEKEEEEDDDDDGFALPSASSPSCPPER